MNISETDIVLDFDLAIIVAELFRVTKLKANKIIKQIKGTVSEWRKVAQDVGLSKAEQDKIRIAFT